MYGTWGGEMCLVTLDQSVGAREGAVFHQRVVGVVGGEP